MFWEKERSWVTRPKFPIYSKALYSFWDPYWLVFVAPQFMLHWRHYVFVLSVMWQRYLFHFTSMLNEYRWNSQDVITTMSKLNSYILGKIGTEVREQDTRKIWIDVNVLPQCQTGADTYWMDSQNSLHKWWYMWLQTQFHVIWEISLTNFI